LAKNSSEAIEKSLAES